MEKEPTGMQKSLSSYGDRKFSQFLRNVFLRGIGYTKEATDKPVNQPGIGTNLINPDFIKKVA